VLAIEMPPFIGEIKKVAEVLFFLQGNRIKFSRVFLGSLYPMLLYKVSS
jgi:hypothetical protein